MVHGIRISFLFLLCLPGIFLNAQIADTLLFVGTYTERGSEGIYVYKWHADGLRLELAQTIADKDSPSFLALHPDGHSLYSANREGVAGQPDWSSITAYRLDPATGKLEVGGSASAYGAGACYIAVDATGKSLFVGNYGSGDLAHYSLDTDGTIQNMLDTFQHAGHSAVKGRQEGPHVHATVVSPDNKQVYVTDLGTDEVRAYSLNPGKQMIPQSITRVKPGTGPRHLAFHPNGGYAYLAGELNSTVTAFRKKADGDLEEMQQLSTLPSNYTDVSYVADIHAHPNGRFVYVSNRGHNSIATFRVEGQSGRLIPVGHTSTEGDWPRNFNLTPDGKFLLVANRRTDDIAIFRIDPQTGMPKYTGESIHVPSPVCLVFRVP